MDKKKIRQGIGRYMGWLGLNFFLLVIKFLPRKCLYAFAKGSSGLVYLIAAKHRKIALEGLGIAFAGEKSQKEIDCIARDCFTFMAKSGLELMYLMDKPGLLKKQVEIVGEENLRQALSQGKGVILVSAHFGNFPLMMARLSLAGYKISGIMRYMRDERAEELFNAKRAKLGIKTIYSQPRRACVETTLRFLRNNEVVFIPIDQNFGSGGVFVDFFGKKAATATGPVVLAQRTGSPLLPSFIIRQKDDTHKIIFEPSFNLKQGKDKDETMIINIQKLTDIIEVYIRNYPAEWSWVHRRWKSRPNPKNHTRR